MTFHDRASLQGLLTPTIKPGSWDMGGGDLHAAQVCYLDWALPAEKRGMAPNCLKRSPVLGYQQNVDGVLVHYRPRADPRRPPAYSRNALYRQSC